MNATQKPRSITPAAALVLVQIHIATTVTPRLAKLVRGAK